MQTPHQFYPQLATTFNLEDVVFKREDLHPYGSHKGRSIPPMIAHYVAKGHHAFCISSSGNAASAAAYTVTDHNRTHPDSPLSLTIYIGAHIDQQKHASLEKLIAPAEGAITLVQDDQPKQRAFLDEKEGRAKNLRQSTDDIALGGYQTLADELRRIPNIGHIFVPSSSGTTAQALIEAFQNDVNIHVHLVQTSACHPLVGSLDAHPPASTQTSIAGAIVDRVAARKNTITPHLQTGRHSGWIVTDSDILRAIDTVAKTCDLTISPNSALAVAGLEKAQHSDTPLTGAVVCLITGP